MNMGLGLQVLALLMLLVPCTELLVVWVMAAQAVSGVAKDLNKMSAKSAIKLLVPSDAPSTLYRWVALLTGSKNALKGLGFFMGSVLLMWLGFQGAIIFMAAGLTVVWLCSIFLLKKELGVAKIPLRFSDIFSKSRAINVLSASRMFLFCARDVWFVVALPVYLSSNLGWSHWSVGGFLALWIIGYGVVQSLAPHLTGTSAEEGSAACHWAVALCIIPLLMALAINFQVDGQLGLLAGLILFGVIFAVNSSLHSYLIVSHAREDAVSLDVGFYYMANAMGRLVGTVLSGVIFQLAGLEACLWVSAACALIAGLLIRLLPQCNGALLLDT